jgi:pheromone alpha factor receptor
MSALATTNYDPLGQNITILDSSETPFNVSIADINYEAHYTLSVATCYAVQLGASAVMLIAVLILTRKPGNHAVFILNVASLVLCFFSRLVFILFFASNFNTFYSLNTFDYRYVTAGDNALVTIGSIIPVFLTATINASLVLQVIGITRQSHFRPWINKLMVGFSAFLFLFSLIFRIILAVENVLEIFKQSNFVAERWLTQIVLASETVTIMWFCGIFSGKLIVMLWVRSKTIWGRQIFLEVIVIGLFYTMFLPSKSSPNVTERTGN